MTTERQHTLVPCATCGTGHPPKHMVSVGDDWLCTQCAGAEIAEFRSIFADMDVDGDRLSIHDPADVHVEHLCETFGYGFVMDSASRLWRRRDPRGAFLSGPCVAVARAALGKEQP